MVLMQGSCKANDNVNFVVLLQHHQILQTLVKYFMHVTKTTQQHIISK